MTKVRDCWLWLETLRGDPGSMLHGLTNVFLETDCPVLQGLLQMKGNQGAGIMLVRAGLREHNR